MKSYAVSDAISDLGPVLNAAPSEAVKGEWLATTEQAGVSSCTGGYVDAAGGFVNPVTGTTSDPFKSIREIVTRLEASQSHHFNKVIIRWRKATMMATLIPTRSLVLPECLGCDRRSTPEREAFGACISYGQIEG